MSNWNIRKIIKDVDKTYLISTGEASRKGDAYNPETMVDRPGGVHFIGSGSIKVLNADGEITGTFTRGQQLFFPNPDDYLAKNTIFVADGPLMFYCVSDPLWEVGLDGTIHDLVANESIDFTGITTSKFDKIYVAEGAITVNAVVHTAPAVLSIETVDSITAVAGAEGALITNFKPIQR